MSDVNKNVNLKLVVKSALRIVDVADLQVDPSYQRGLVPKHKKIASGFNPEALGIPIVAEREDGSKWIVDGQQRIAALRILGRTKVRVELFNSRGPEHEAEVFRLINLNRTKLRSTDEYFALLTAGDKAAWKVKELVEAAGFRIVRGHANEDRTPDQMILSTPGVFMQIIRGKDGKSGGDGPGCLAFVLAAIKGSWVADPQRGKSEIIDGLAKFFVRHEGVVDIDRLIPRLGTTTCAKLLYSAKLGVGDRGNNVADVIERLYRKRAVKK